jgi:excisionase family DNA binding protein
MWVRVSRWAGGEPLAEEPMSTPSLWKVADVAQFMNMSVSWVYKEAEAGRLPCIRIGASLRFRPDVISEFVERLSQRVRPLSYAP